MSSFKKNTDSYNIKIDEKSNKNNLIYYIGYVTVKDLKFVKTNSVSPLSLILQQKEWIL